MAYPVSFDIQRPTEFDKAQIALRIIIIVLISWLVSWAVGAAYWVLPILAAVLVSQKGAERYLAEAETGPVTWLRYLMGFYAYIGLGIDKLPLEKPGETVNLQVTTSGTPTVGSALLRIILGLPSAIVLGLLGIVFFIFWIIAVISILFSGSYPDFAFTFIRGYLRWQARLLAYMASLVDEYPPFAFDELFASGTAAPPAPQIEPPSTPPPATPS